MTKRQGGQLKDSEWLVLTESTGKEKLGYKHKCGTKIMGTRVSHPIWDGPFKCSGGGEVHVERIPYCPKCEEKPSEHGAPIDVPFPGVPVKF